MVKFSIIVIVKMSFLSINLSEYNKVKLSEFQVSFGEFITSMSDLSRVLIETLSDKTHETQYNAPRTLIAKIYIRDIRTQFLNKKILTGIKSF